MKQIAVRTVLYTRCTFRLASIPGKCILESTESADAALNNQTY